MLIYNVHTLQKTFALTYKGRSQETASIPACTDSDRGGIIRETP